MPRSSSRYVGQLGAAAERPPREVGIEVEGAARRPAARAARRHHLVGRFTDRPVQAPARGDVLDQLRRLGERVGGGVLHRRGERRPDLARQPADRGAGLLPEPPVGQPHEPDAPAAERQVLAQAGGDERALREQLRRAHERLVGEVAVDLVGDDHQARRLGDLAHLAHQRLRGDGAGRVVGQREHEDARPRADALRLGERGAEMGRVGHAARLLADRHADHPLAGDRRVCGVADPARHRQHDVAGQHLQQRVEQRLAAGREHDLIGRRLQPPAPEVAGRRLARRRRPGDRPVAVAPRALGQPLRHRGQHRQPRLAERQVQDVLARRELGAHALVGRQRGRRGHGGDEFRAQHWSQSA